MVLQFISSFATSPRYQKAFEDFQINIGRCVISQLTWCLLHDHCVYKEQEYYFVLKYAYSVPEKISSCDFRVPPSSPAVMFCLFLQKVSSGNILNSLPWWTVEKITCHPITFPHCATLPESSICLQWSIVHKLYSLPCKFHLPFE